MVASGTTSPPAGTPAYPVRLTMEYPERVSRLSTAFRIILAVPVIVFLALIAGAGGWPAAGGIVVAIWAAILVGGHIPRWLFNFHVGVHRFTYRAYAYIALLTDAYPAFEGDWALQYDVEYPQRLSRRRLVIWKLITAIPHFIVLFFLAIASALVIFIAWWVILFTGVFPRGLHRFVVGVMRWSARVTAYAESLTDEFPPFSLDEDAGPADRGTIIASSIGGVILAALLIGGGTAGGVAAYTVLHKTKTIEVAYDSALRGDLPPEARQVTFDKVQFTLSGGDNAFSSDLVGPRDGYHIVEFTVEYENRKVLRASGHKDIELNLLRLKTDHGTEDARILTADGAPAPLNVQHGRRITLRAYFEISVADRVLELDAYPVPGNPRHIVWKFSE